MSIDLNWEAATSGPDGEELAERIRSFIHDKFQQIPLPRFIRSVNVHSFDFGSIAPELEIKDICDPFVDFYEDDDSAEDEDDDDNSDGTPSDTSSDPDEATNQPSIRRGNGEEQNKYNDGHKDYINHHDTIHQDHLRTSRWVTGEDGHQSPLRSPIGLGDHLNAQFRSATPNILPGVTSNLGYHLMMGGLSGAQTPLAAVAGGTSFATGWPDAVMHGSSRATGAGAIADRGGGRDNAHTHNRRTENSIDYNASSRPSTANTNPTQLSHGRSAGGSSSNNTSNDPTVIYNDHASSTTTTAHVLPDNEKSRDKSSSIRPDLQEETAPHMRERRPEDFQIVCRVKYSGDVKLSLTAEILLDYPMPSFVGLPLKLNITGVTFDGVAVVAYIRRRAHVCFLSPEDADALLGDEEEQDNQQRQQSHAYSTSNTATTGAPIGVPPTVSIIGTTEENHDNNTSHNPEDQPLPSRRRFGSLLQQIRVESEIGRKENGKQVLKNVGKVERFVLDQVRRIFEDEFVFPSFWTFLI